MKLNSRNIFVGAILLVMFAGLFLFTVNAEKMIDDWQYDGSQNKYSHTTSYYSHNTGMAMPNWSIAVMLILFFTLLPLLFIAWLILSVLLILKSEPKDENNKKKHPNKILGITGLIFPPVFILLAIVLLIIGIITLKDMFFILVFVSVPVLLGYLIWNIIYISKHKKTISKGLSIWQLIIILFSLVLSLLLMFSLGLSLTQSTATHFSSQAMGSSGAINKQAATMEKAADSGIGYSVGGAKDTNNFRQNIKEDYLPLPTDITYEGLFYEYYFDTGSKEKCHKLFCPSYSKAVSPDPISKEKEKYLSVGLNSGIKNFSRKKLNLVIVLDISGSMSSPFNQYYYDRFGNKQEIENKEDLQKDKIEVAKESIKALTKHLNEDDRVSIVLFESQSHLAKPMRKVGKTDMKAIRKHIEEIEATGGTNFEAGYKKATGQLEKFSDANPEKYENRIIYLTDAMPNTGRTGKDSLLGMTKKNAKSNLYSTFIGIGVDFNTKLIDHITKVEGANYYSVHSPQEFRNRMDKQFEYMVTPLVFNLTLKLESNGYDIEKVYGSPEANESTGEIMKVNTLFPSSKVKNKTKGGIILLKLDKISNKSSLDLKASYKDRNGKQHVTNSKITFDKNKEYYDNTGIRKAIVLSRYTDLMKNWIKDERESLSQNQPVNPTVTKEKGIVVPEPVPQQKLSKWERQSVNLKISNKYKDYFSKFKNYLKTETNELEDSNLKQEYEILEELIKK